jgi:hypothetical protein
MDYYLPGGDKARYLAATKFKTSRIAGDARRHTTIITGFSISALNAPISSAPSAPSTAR